MKARLREISSSDIKVGSRHRKDISDLKSLVENIRTEGLLQANGVPDKLELVFGECRLRAIRDILSRRPSWVGASGTWKVLTAGDQARQSPVTTPFHRQAN